MANAFDLGFMKINYYAIAILAGIVFAYIVIWLEAKKYGYNKEFMGNLIFWVIIFGIIGARLYYVIFNLDYYMANPSEIYKIWNGGLAIHGGIIFGIIITAIYCKKYEISIIKTFDIFVVGLILGQAVGRWGNFFNGEAHGGAVSRSVLEGLKIVPNFVINGMKIDGVYYHPTFYYEFLWCLLGFIVLLLVRRFYKYLKLGQLTGLYFMWYGIGRLFIESMRTDSLMLGNIKMAQIVSIVLIIIGLILFIKKLIGSKFDYLYEEEYADEIKF